MSQKIFEDVPTITTDNLYQVSSTVPGFLIILSAIQSAIEADPSRDKVFTYADWLYSTFNLSNDECIQTFCTGLLISVYQWLDTKNYNELITSMDEVIAILLEDLQ